MEFTYENQGTNAFLVYELGEEDQLDSLSLGMLTNNQIPGMAPAIFTQMDTQKFIKYNVTSKVAAAQVFSGIVNRKRLLGLFSGILSAVSACGDYMLDPASLVLDLEHIYMDISTGETQMICLPLLNPQKAQSLSDFFKMIVFRTQYDQTENCDHVAQLLNYLNSNPNLPLDGFKNLIDQLMGVKQAPVQQPMQVPVQQPMQAPVQQPVQAPVQQPVQAPVQRPVQAPVQQPMQAPIQRPVQIPVQKSVQPPVMPPVPPKKQKPAAPTAPAAPAAQESAEKPMSWLYLMQHYSKENKAIYKAQQEAKKTQIKTPGVPAYSAPVPPEPKQKKQKAGPAVPGGIPIPGAPAGMAIPGRPEIPVPGKAAAYPNPAPHSASQFATQPVQQTVSQPAAQPIQQTVPQPVIQAVPMNFGETTVLGGDMGETTVLCQPESAAASQPYLVRVKNSERVNVDKPVFRIGKERSYVDYFIGDNTAISRSHANIENRNGEYFLMDTNSKNHSYVNGAMLQSNIPVKLEHGNRIRLANEDFDFFLY